MLVIWLNFHFLKFSLSWKIHLYFYYLLSFYNQVQANGHLQVLKSKQNGQTKESLKIYYQNILVLNWFTRSGKFLTVFGVMLSGKEGTGFPTFHDGKILVPYAIESCLSGIQKLVGESQKLWFQRNFAVPGTRINKKCTVEFWCCWLESSSVAERYQNRKS